MVMELWGLPSGAATTLFVLFFPRWQGVLVYRGAVKSPYREVGDCAFSGGIVATNTAHSLATLPTSRFS